MSRQQRPEPIAAHAQDVLRAPDRPHIPAQRFGLWLTTREAHELIGSTSLHGTRCWLQRHGIIRRQNGTVSRDDITRELRRQSGRGRHANSRANLNQRKDDASVASATAPIRLLAQRAVR